MEKFKKKKERILSTAVEVGILTMIFVMCIALVNL